MSSLVNIPPVGGIRRITSSAAAQTFNMTVLNGEAPVMWRATGTLISDGTDRNITMLINGSAVNVTMEIFGTSNGVATVAFTSIVGDTGTGQMNFEIVFLPSHGATTAIKRMGFIRTSIMTSTGLVFGTYAGYFGFKDSTTTITSVGFDCAFATGIAAGSFAVIEEYPVPAS